ncbi:hypothetical protein HID58_092878, partial [Brassica napus]
IEVLLGWLKHYSSPKLRTCPFTKPVGPGVALHLALTDICRDGEGMNASHVIIFCHQNRESVLQSFSSVLHQKQESF